MLDGFQVYKRFVALKNHFVLDNYDFVRYGGKTTVTMKSYLKRKDRFFFEKIARRVQETELNDYIVGNLIMGDNGLDVAPEKIWIGVLADGEAKERALKYMARVQSLEYNFKKDLTVVLENASMSKGQYPLLLTLYFLGKIGPETLIILDALLGTFDTWDNTPMRLDPIWTKTRTFLRKYERIALPNLPQDIEKYDKILREHLSKSAI